MLKEYLARFNLLTLEIQDLDERIIMHQITVGLWVGHFLLSLAKKPVISLTNLLPRSKKHINVKKVEMARS